MTPLREGYTTGTCAATAACAAARVLVGDDPPSRVELLLPNGEPAILPVASAGVTDDGAEASVIKDAGDDPDVTDGARIVVTLAPLAAGDLIFHAGPGVGTVTKPGLSVPPGEPAINPVPRAMIRDAIRGVTDAPLSVTVGIPGGEALAARTFNPRLGVAGGLSILGTSGKVRPYSHEAIVETILCALNVAAASGVSALVLVPGHIGRRAAEALFSVVPDQIVEVSNAWDAALPAVAARSFRRLLLLGHPGKLAKFVAGHWNTHSKHSPPAAAYVAALAEKITGETPASGETVEGVFQALAPGDRARLGATLAAQVRDAVKRDYERDCAVVLVDMSGCELGRAGETTPWQT